MSHSRIKFYGSQVGGKIVTPLSYTGSPSALLRHDVFSALGLLLFTPFIVMPLSPCRSGELCELYPSLANTFCMVLHFILVVMQLLFLASMWIWPLFPLWFVLVGVAGFGAVNQGICYVLNGSKMRYHSDPKYAKWEKEHEHEQWIFLNGVAVGKHWLQSNIDRLALTFGRPIIGVHNKTNGIIFDVLQCLIQRNFNYATQDIRDCYAIVKSTLYTPGLTKVIFILHSQGGIEGGMIIDWLLQEVPQDLLAKLEVYTFGNAANHFNNPHLHLLSQHAALRNPGAVSSTHITTQVHFHDPIPPLHTTNGHVNGNGNGNATGEVQLLNGTPATRSSKQSSSSGKTIRYIEHYAHTSDFVARWGVLHYLCNYSLSASAPRFMGRVFERQGGGHQFNQHYLDNMFPLKRSLEKGGGIGGSGFEGADEDAGGFMSEVVEWGLDGDEKRDEREGMEMSYLGAHGEPLNRREEDVLVRDMSPVSPGTIDRALKREFENGRGFTKNDGLVNGDGKKWKMEFRVRDLSRLWLYVNGKSPKTDEVDVGIARMATI